MLTVLVFVMVLGVFQTVNQGLALSRERLGADAILIPKYASAEGVDPQEFVKQVERSGMEAKCILTGDTISSLQSRLDDGVLIDL